MLKLYKANFFNFMYERIDPIVCNSSQYDLEFLDNYGNIVIYRIRSIKDNGYVAYLLDEKPKIQYNLRYISPNNKVEYNLLINTFFTKEQIENFENLNLSKISFEKEKKLTFPIDFRYNNSLLDSLMFKFKFTYFRLMCSFNFKQGLTVSRYIIDNKWIVEIIDNENYKGYSIIANNKFIQRRNSYYSLCKYIAKDMDIPKIIVRTVGINLFDNAIMLKEILYVFKCKRTNYMNNKTNFEDTIIISNLSSGNAKEMEMGMKLILSKEQFDSIKYTLYGTRNISILSNYILGNDHLLK